MTVDRETIEKLTYEIVPQHTVPTLGSIVEADTQTSYSDLIFYCGSVGAHAKFCDRSPYPAVVSERFFY